MKTNKISLQQLLLAAALALPLASHAADMTGPGHGAGLGSGMPPGGPDGERGPGGPGGFGGPGPGHDHDRQRGFMHGMDLNEAQQDQVFTILHAQEPYIREQSRALRMAQQALDEMGKADKYDDAKATSLAKAAAQAMSNLELQRVRTDQKLLGVLSAEQRKQLDQRKPPRP